MLSCGVDLIEIRRVQDAMDRHGRRFLERVFTPQELTEAGGRAASLAARFAAKEAVSKALGTGIGVVCWQEIEIVRDDAHRPVLRLHGAAARLAAELGLKHWSLSLSHSQSQAIAMVIALSGPDSNN
jgi:holo-[acyl-carrier protein] synthase